MEETARAYQETKPINSLKQMDEPREFGPEMSGWNACDSSNTHPFVVCYVPLFLSTFCCRIPQFFVHFLWIFVHVLSNFSIFE